MNRNEKDLVAQAAEAQERFGDDSLEAHAAAIERDRLRNRLRDNWEHKLVGQKHSYVLQAGADRVRIEFHGSTHESLIPIEELRELIAEYDSTNADVALEKARKP